MISSRLVEWRRNSAPNCSITQARKSPEWRVRMVSLPSSGMLPWPCMMCRFTVQAAVTTMMLASRPSILKMKSISAVARPASMPRMKAASMATSGRTPAKSSTAQTAPPMGKAPSTVRSTKPSTRKVRNTVTPGQRVTQALPHRADGDVAQRHEYRSHTGHHKEAQHKIHGGIAPRTAHGSHRQRSFRPECEQPCAIIERQCYPLLAGTQAFAPAGNCHGANRSQARQFDSASIRAIMNAWTRATVPRIGGYQPAGDCISVRSSRTWPTMKRPRQNSR